MWCQIKYRYDYLPAERKVIHTGGKHTAAVRLGSVIYDGGAGDGIIIIVIVDAAALFGCISCNHAAAYSNTFLLNINGAAITGSGVAVKQNTIDRTAVRVAENCPAPVVLDMQRAAVAAGCLVMGNGCAGVLRFENELRIL